MMAVVVAAIELQWWRVFRYFQCIDGCGRNWWDGGKQLPSYILFLKEALLLV